MCYGIICHKQAVGIFVLLCIFLGGFPLRCERISIHCSGVGKGDIVHCFIRQCVIHRAENVFGGEVKVIGAAGGEGELLVRLLFHRQRNVCEITGIVGLFIAVALLAEDL